MLLGTKNTKRRTPVFNHVPVTVVLEVIMTIHNFPDGGSFTQIVVFVGSFGVVSGFIAKMFIVGKTWMGKKGRNDVIIGPRIRDWNALRIGSRVTSFVIYLQAAYFTGGRRVQCSDGIKTIPVRSGRTRCYLLPSTVISRGHPVQWVHWIILESLFIKDPVPVLDPLICEHSSSFWLQVKCIRSCIRHKFL